MRPPGFCPLIAPRTSWVSRSAMGSVCCGACAAAAARRASGLRCSGLGIVCMTSAGVMRPASNSRAKARPASVPSLRRCSTIWRTMASSVMGWAWAGSTGCPARGVMGASMRAVISARLASDCAFIVGVIHVDGTTVYPLPAGCGTTVKSSPRSSLARRMRTESSSPIGARSVDQRSMFARPMSLDHASACSGVHGFGSSQLGLMPPWASAMNCVGAPSGAGRASGSAPVGMTPVLRPISEAKSS